MTATTLAPAPTTANPSSPVTIRPRVLRPGLAAGAGAAVATATYAAVAHAAGVSFAVGGKEIPALGFGQVTFVAALIGIAIAAVAVRRAADARRVFLRTTVALTALSFVPDALADAPNGTRLALAISHVVAAAIVIPVLAGRCAD